MRRLAARLPCMCRTRPGRAAARPDGCQPIGRVTIKTRQPADYRACGPPAPRATVQLMTTSTTTNPSQIGDNELIEAVLAAGRALVSVALRSLHESAPSAGRRSRGSCDGWRPRIAAS